MQFEKSKIYTGEKKIYGRKEFPYVKGKGLVIFSQLFLNLSSIETY